MRKSLLIYGTCAAITSLIAIEGGLRLAVGLGNPPLVIADEEMGYRFKPNQKLYRFGNRVEYNQFSQRSEPIEPQKSQGTFRILMLGDSVLNGGNRTDQGKTISEQLEAKLSKEEESVEVLNASANSWGIGNQLGYLRKFGTFESDVVILQIGTHDLLQPTSTGKNLAQTEKPPSAISEAIFTYILPRLRGWLASSSAVKVNAAKPLDMLFQENLERLDAIARLVREQNIPLYILYTPDRRDLLPTPNEPPYKTQFFQHLATSNIPITDTHNAWSKLPPQTAKSYFVDSVHLSLGGQQSVADLLFQQLRENN
ncbi:SGNH/GDSL hydrolase family protein [Lusitaniella coriacea]|uniref:SGNH/GDSL hydrolase family protein n=1 Tax=Lusitaniella coriacea TaxID=1983105 RepID=UPI003CEBD5B8